MRTISSMDNSFRIICELLPDIFIESLTLKEWPSHIYQLFMLQLIKFQEEQPCIDNKFKAFIIMVNSQFQE